MTAPANEQFVPFEQARVRLGRLAGPPPTGGEPHRLVAQYLDKIRLVAQE